MKIRQIASLDDVDQLETAIVSSAEVTANAIRDLLSGVTGIRLLSTLKFEKAGRDPLFDRPLNFVEQINQTFTYLASCQAVRYLFTHHAARAPFTLHLGTTPGPDIVSNDRTLIAEVFAATHPSSNGKLHKDLKKLRTYKADIRYLFFSCPGDDRALRADADVRVVSLGLFTRPFVGDFQSSPHQSG